MTWNCGLIYHLAKCPIRRFKRMFPLFNVVGINAIYNLCHRFKTLLSERSGFVLKYYPINNETDLIN